MALLGPSGSGKTTALRAVAGFVRPASGRVFLGGRDVTALPPHRRGIGMVVQSYALFPHLKVKDNVAFGLKAHRTPKAEIPGRVAEALELVGMAAYAERHPRELSGGQQQRVAIARALAIRPGVLLLDEPLSALDARLRSGMLAELARLHRELPDVSILYVTHDQVEALTLADRIAVMDRARLQDCGTPRSCTGDPVRSSPPRSSATPTCSRSPSPATGPSDSATAPSPCPPAPPPPAPPPPSASARTWSASAPGPTRSPAPSPRSSGAAPPTACTPTSTATPSWPTSANCANPPALGTPVTLHFAPEDAVLLPAGSA